jgi:hypothetical protein
MSGTQSLTSSGVPARQTSCYCNIVLSVVYAFCLVMGLALVI